MEQFDGIISLLIACIELFYIGNLLYFAKKNSVNLLSILLLALLFLYQLTEFLICFAGIREEFIVYLAFLIISFLPPLGFIVAAKFTGYQKPYFPLLFVVPLFFALYYLFVLERFGVAKCTVLYAAYNYPLGELYAFFYYLPILLTLILLYIKLANEKDKKRRGLIKLLLNGFQFTFYPAIIIVIFVPGFIDAVESLLCKLAFILAIFIFLFVLKNKNGTQPINA